MRVFVASWFFPPATSSEGIVAFKLLSHSVHEYDVSSSISKQWGYDAELPLRADNITSYPIETDSIQEWVDYSIQLFEELHATRQYDCIMTRSMPPESVEVGIEIKRRYPDIFWIASFGDPLVQTPMMTHAIKTDGKLTSDQKKAIIKRMGAARPCSDYLGLGGKYVDMYCRYKDYEVSAFENADMFVCPNGPQAHLMLCGKRRSGVEVIPHSYDEALYQGTPSEEADTIQMVFLGSSNADRSLEPFVQALQKLRINNPNALRKIHMRFIGNIADSSRSIAYNYYLTDNVTIEGNVSYLESLKIMREADWLLHVDAYYSAFKSTGGSVYLAGKLADYIGSGTPILALTGAHSPAGRLVESCGGIVCSQRDIASLAETLEMIALGVIKCRRNADACKMYAAEAVGRMLDDAITRMADARAVKRAEVAPKAPSETNWKNKLITICVPAYNVEEFLDRCLGSLVSCSRVEALEVLVVNDGSKDDTRSVALRFENAYPSIIKLIDKQNGGHGSTINAALAQAHGQYFKVLDGDDWLDPVELESLIDKIESLEEPVDLISTDYCQIRIETGAITPIRKKSKHIEYDKVYNVENVNFDNEYFSLGSTTYRLSVLKESNLSLSENSFYVDVQYQMIPLPFVRTIMFTKGNLYHYAIGRPDQSVSHNSFVSRYDNHDSVIRGALDYYMQNHSCMGKNVKSYYEKLILDNFIKSQFTVALLFDDNKKRGFSRARDFDEYLKLTNKEWYDIAGNKYPVLKELRKIDFDPSRAPKFTSLSYKSTSLKKRVARKAVKKLMAGGIGGVVESEVSKRQKKKKQ